ncbi:mitoferrin-1-like [Apostichopus japonicus]|uniref:mitoferrin-1-like n=1 Tax=Stichopus japonicus TaxID=307972 RepID=UPI003AB779E7
MPTDTVALSRMAEISSPKLRGAIGVPPSLPRIPDHGFRVRISDMDNPESEHAAEEYDYESLPETSSFTTFMIAGAIAGIMEHCVMYPVDCVKTRMQALSPAPGTPHYRNVGNALKTIVRQEGLSRTLRGLPLVATGAGPSHALYFACYEKLKTVLSAHPGKNPFANAVAGGVATIVHDAAMNPVDVIKQRLQMYHSPFTSAVQCIKHVYRTEGLGAFYRSYSTQLTMNIPFQCMHFVAYEFGQEFLNPTRRYNPVSHVVAGGLAGAVAAALTTPLDVCKTLLNTQEACIVTEKNGIAISGMKNAFRTVYHKQGLKGYFKGLQARVIFQMPATALSWSVYEFFKYSISRQRAGG